MDEEEETSGIDMRCTKDPTQWCNADVECCQYDPALAITEFVSITYHKDGRVEKKIIKV